MQWFPFVPVGLCATLALACTRSGARSGSDAGEPRPSPSVRSEGGHDAGGQRPAGDSFEGIVHLSTPLLDGPSADSIFEIKGTRSRWRHPGDDDAESYRIYDAKARRLFTVLPKQSSVIANDVTSGAAAPVRWSFTPLGDGRVGGFPCARFHATDGTQRFSFCATPTLPIPLEFAFPRESIPFLTELEAREQTPLAVALESEGGARHRPAPKLIAVEIRPTPLDDGRFTLPDFPVTERSGPPPHPLPR